MIKLSIIVPVYNVENYLCKCIDSILNQNFKDFEVILVDDGSIDRSGKICDIYANKDNRVKVIHKNNGGLSSARNMGLDVAKGEYIGFVDSDDWIEPDMYERMYNEIIKTNSDIIVCNFKKVFKNVEESYIYRNKSLDLNNIEALNELYNIKYIYNLAWNKIYKKSLFDNLRYKEGFIYEDEFIIHHLLYKSNKTRYIPENFYNYYQREGSIINSKFNIRKYDRVLALGERIEFFKKIKLNDLVKKAEKEYVDLFIWNYFLVKRNIKNCNEDLLKFKEDFKKKVNSILKNDLISLKYKISILVFIINDNLYGKLIGI